MDDFDLGLLDDKTFLVTMLRCVLAVRLILAKKDICFSGMNDRHVMSCQCM